MSQFANSFGGTQPVTNDQFQSGNYGIYFSVEGFYDITSIGYSPDGNSAASFSRHRVSGDSVITFGNGPGILGSSEISFLLTDTGTFFVKDHDAGFNIALFSSANTTIISAITQIEGLTSITLLSPGPVSLSGGNLEFDSQANVQFNLSEFVNFEFSSDASILINSTAVVKAQQPAVADAAGGVVIDIQARAQLNALLARLRAATGHGLIA